VDFFPVGGGVKPVAELGAKAIPAIARRVAGTAGPLEQAGSEALWGKTAYMLPPPKLPPRPFSADYPRGAPTDEASRLTADIDGRPLRAQYIAGRRVPDGPDVGLTPTEILDIANKATGKQPQAYSDKKMKGDFGFYDPKTRQLASIKNCCQNSGDTF
jgi:hypothetical protein